jgi:TM2 domain-containing membrane protein YozV
MILGLEGAGVIAAYFCTIIAVTICVIYGIINWNKSGENESKEIEEEIKWEKKDAVLESVGGKK